MKKFQFLVNSSQGIHARPAVLLAHAAQQYQSAICLKCEERLADGKDLMDLMNLNAACGDTVTVEMNGSDEEAAWEGMRECLRNGGDGEFRLLGE